MRVAKLPERIAHSVVVGWFFLCLITRERRSECLRSIVVQAPISG